MTKTINDKIKQIGLKYCGHYNTSKIQVVGTTWRLDIPTNKIGEFTRLFPDVNGEDGEFIECLKGRYIRVTYDENMVLHSLHHIVKDIDYII